MWMTLNHVIPYRTKATYFVSHQGIKYDFSKYNKPGNTKYLPNDGYPYTIEYEEWQPPLWWRNAQIVNQPDINN